MADTYQPNKRNIGQLLSVTSPSIIVPDWQRNYSWTRSHVETFWNDLSAFEAETQHPSDGEYFLGSVVIVDTPEGKHLLLDGQQRIATAAILLSVIRDYLVRYNRDASLRVQQRYLADIDDATGETDFKLTLNAYDREYFRRLILEYRNVGYAPPQPELPSHHNILTARVFF